MSSHVDTPILRARRLNGVAPNGLRFGLVLLLLATAALTGCTNPSLVRVKPWQRATLADYTMRPDRDPLDTAMSEHIYYSRETASGGRGVGGSGCGCN